MLALVFLTGSCADRPAEPFFIEAPVFVSGTDGYDTFRIPAVVVTMKGTVLALCEGRKNGRNDTGDINLVLRRSEDGGETWGPLQVIWDDGENVCGNPCPVVDRDTGRIWLLSTHNLGSDGERAIWNQTGEGSRTVWLLWSDDDGATWSGPRDITSDVKKDDWTWYATGPGVGIQLVTGRLVIPCDHGVAVTMDYQSHVIYSDDHGRTWRLGGSVPDIATSECQVVERDDGSLLMNIRSYPKRPGFRVVSESTDGGMNWSETSLDRSLPSPGCQGSILTYPRADTSGKSRVIFSCPADKKARVNMTVRLSYDGAKTWPVTGQIFPGPSAYSCLSVMRDGTIGCFYECGKENAYETIALARFNLEWLTDGADNGKGAGR